METSFYGIRLHGPPHCGHRSEFTSPTVILHLGQWTFAALRDLSDQEAWSPTRWAALFCRGGYRGPNVHSSTAVRATITEERTAVHSASPSWRSFSIPFRPDPGRCDVTDSDALLFVPGSDYCRTLDIQRDNMPNTAGLMLPTISVNSSASGLLPESHVTHVSCLPLTRRSSSAVKADSSPSTIREQFAQHQIPLSIEVRSSGIWSGS